MTDLDMLAQVRTWVECETPTRDIEGLTRLAGMIAHDYAALGAKVETIEGRDGHGPHLVAHLPAARPCGNRCILILSHIDTVHPRGTLSHFPFSIEGDRAYGPGIYDMKAGALLAMQAVGQAHTAGSLKRPVIHLFVSDEEEGSPTSRSLIATLASEAKYVLVTEPAREGGLIVIGRKGVIRYRVQAKGRPAHSGARHQDGRSAILEIAKVTVALEALTDYVSGTTVNVGVIGGGTASNVVPAAAFADVDIRVDNLRQAKRVEAFIAAYQPSNPDVKLSFEGGMTRPPYETTPDIRSLFDQARVIAARQGLDLRGLRTGGGSDGNLTAMIAPTLDGLGADGAGGHTLEEYIRISSLTERCTLMRGLLETLE